MAKLELSTTLKNLKFMQRATRHEDKQKIQEQVKPNSNFVSSNTHMKCIVLMEGSPHPGALKGRMSFQSFNPSIDKLNEGEATLCQSQASATSSGDQIRSNRENDSSQIKSEGLNVSRPSSDSDVDHKRKQPEVDEEAQYPNKSQRNISDGDDQSSTLSSGEGSYRRRKREKLNWNVLRPPKAESKRF